MGRPVFTWGSPEGVAAVIARLPDRYEMTLSPADMTVVIDALMSKWESLDQVDPDTGSVGDERVMSLLSAIAQTVGVEWV